MIFAVAVVYQSLELLPHFLRHYTQMGVDRILVAAEESIYREVDSIASQAGAWAFRFQRKQFDCLDKYAIEKHLLFLADVKPDDYVMYLDVDELQEYPAPLDTIVREMDRRNLWAVRGWLIDRLAADGRLRSIQPEPSLWDQFPVKCRLTNRLLGGSDQKIMLCRGKVELNSGHHDTKNAYYHDVPVCGDYWVHHFKWHAAAVEWSRQKVAGGVSEYYRGEVARFFEVYERTGRFDLSSPHLGIIR